MTAEGVAVIGVSPMVKTGGGGGTFGIWLVICSSEPRETWDPGMVTADPLGSGEGSEKMGSEPLIRDTGRGIPVGGMTSVLVVSPGVVGTGPAGVTGSGTLGGSVVLAVSVATAVEVTRVVRKDTGVKTTKAGGVESSSSLMHCMGAKLEN
jgi:hypothetical protein